MNGSFKPQTFRQRWMGWDFVFEILGAAIPLVACAIAAAKLSKADPESARVSFAAGVVSFLILVARAIYHNYRAQGKEQRIALDGALATLHAVLENQSPKHVDSGLRICVFVPGNGENIVHQISNYAGTDPPSGANRDHSVRCGVVGAAFRTGQAAYDKLPANVHIVDHLAAVHGFAREEASQMKQDCKAWAAIPIGDASKVEAVIFLDCKIRDYFGNANQLRRKTLEAATVGVAKFMRSA